MGMENIKNFQWKENRMRVGKKNKEILDLHGNPSNNISDEDKVVRLRDYQMIRQRKNVESRHQGIKKMETEKEMYQSSRESLRTKDF